MTFSRPGRRLGLDDFAFHGFGERIEQVAWDLPRLTIPDDEPKVAVLENAMFVPDAIYAAKGRSADRGGLLDIDGQPIPEAVGRRGPSGPIEVEPEAEIDDEVVYLGWHFGQYGHFLLESLARTWSLDRIDPSVRVLFNLDPRRLSTNQREILAAFGIPPQRLLILDRPTLLRRVIVPEPLYELAHWAHERAAEPYRAVATRILERDGGPGASEQPLYLSRRLLASHQRQLVGEMELEDVLRENGFLIVHPEMMSFEDQVRVINRHAHIFTVDGTAAHNILFALQHPDLHLLTDGIVQRDYFLTPVAAGVESHFVVCLSTGERATPGIKMFRVLPQALDWEPLRQHLGDCGFLAKQRRARLAGKFEEHRQEQHTEVWMHVRLDIAARTQETLDPAEEEEIIEFAATSWPVSLGLALYCAERVPPQAVEFALQFAQLVAFETNGERIVRFEGRVMLLMRALTKYAPEAAGRLAKLLSDRFIVDRWMPK